METMLNYSFSPKGIHPLSVSIFLVGLVYVGILFLTTLYKNPTQSSLNTELQNILVCADYYSWQIYGFVYYINHLEQLRNLKEGLMDKNAWSGRGYPNYYDSATTWMGDGAGLSYLPDKLIDLEYSKVNATELGRLDEWFSAKIDLWRYEMIPATGKPRWWKDTYGRATAVKNFNIRSEGIARRDYENDTMIADIWNGTDYDFNLDPEEHWTRLNSVGHLLESYTKLSWMNYDFVKRVVTHSEDIGLLLVWISAIASAVFLLFILSVIYYKSRSMTKMLKIIFVFDNEIFHRELNMIKDQQLLIEKVFIDIKDYDRESDKQIQKQDRREKEKKSNKARKQLKRFDNISASRIFNMNIYIWLALVMVFFALSIQLVSYFWINSLNVTAKNLLNVYCTGVEFWASYFTTWTMAVLTVRYNNTLPAWSNATTYDMYQYYEGYIKDNLIDNYTLLLGKDLYNYTGNYSKAFETGDSCADWLYTNTPWCEDEYLNGSTRDNIIVMLKGIRIQIMGFIGRWLGDRGSWDAIKKNWRAQDTWDLMGGYNKLCAKVYYWVILPATDAIFGVATRNTDVLYF